MELSINLEIIAGTYRGWHPTVVQSCIDRLMRIIERESKA